MPAAIPRVTSALMARMTSSLNGQAVLFPIWAYVERDAGGLSLLGRVPGVYLSNATAKGFAVGSTFAIGADSYMVFPNFVVKKVT
ncbi:MAG: hypothetical protein BWY56_01895 [Acidobacteria bacterium ADurb.Bin340]|nr:MAG: hypothetical protein BWY56_01895 [Acidobacteria bacterium ADurb.Bin340]